MTILEIAGMLGDAIKADETAKNMAKAEEAYSHDELLLSAVAEYNAQQAAIAEEYKKPQRDSLAIAALQKRIDDLYETITKSQTFITFSEAQDKMNALMSEVNDEINFRVTGERACTHDCSSCGGCH